jgi:hypothetical protein
MVLPDPNVHQRPVALGSDFMVFHHWGRVPMWNSTTVAQNPGTPASWTRLSFATMDDNTNYATDPAGTTHRLHYRLDPVPFQDAVPPNAPPDLLPDLARVAGHFQSAASFFTDVYEFAVTEYSDNNAILGPLPAGTVDTPTPIDSQVGHRILHPNYPSPNNPLDTGRNGRGAHINHLHFQLGPTFYNAPRTT